MDLEIIHKVKNKARTKIASINLTAENFAEQTNSRFWYGLKFLLFIALSMFYVMKNKKNDSTLNVDVDLLPRQFKFQKKNLELREKLGAGAFGVVFKSIAQV